MPDVHTPGAGHRPLTDVAGHYLGMHAPPDPQNWKPEQLWWRGDEVAEMRADLKRADERARVLRDQVTDIVAHASDLEAQLMAANQRRGPKRAGKQRG
jgi:hypothetical protein